MGGEPEIKLVPVGVFSGGTASLDAELARNILAAEGIEGALPGDIAAETIPVLEVHLLVRQEDAQRAAEILEAYFDTPGERPIPESNNLSKVGDSEELHGPQERRAGISEAKVEAKGRDEARFPQHPPAKLRDHVLSC